MAAIKISFSFFCFEFRSSEIRWKRFGEKRPFLFQLEILFIKQFPIFTQLTKLIILLLLNIPMQCVIHFYKPLVLSKWKSDGKGNIQVVNKSCKQKHILQGISSSTIYSILLIFIITSKILSNSITKWNRIKDIRLVISVT